MCKFCEENFRIETTIGNKDLVIYLDENNKKILDIRLPFKRAGGITKPIIIQYCPFCGNDLKELNCKQCFNYNIGDGVDDISKCKDCKYK